jgi:hypothetical protein
MHESFQQSYWIESSSNLYQVLKFQGHTLYDTNKVLGMQKHPITTMKEFCSILPLLGPPNVPCETPPPPSEPTPSTETDNRGLFDQEEVSEEYRYA